MNATMPAGVRAEARVDLQAIRDNVAYLCERAGPAELMAVVKDDGYGHGLVPSALAARQGGASWLGTAMLAEALALRRAGVDGRILAWLGVPGEPWGEAIRADVDLSASATWTVEEIAEGARQTGRPARLHLKVDTGLGRAGAPAGEWPTLVDAALKAQADGLLTVVGLWSHLAAADVPGHPSVANQLAAFRSAIEHAERAGVRHEVRHLANSAATLLLPETHLDLVRPGIAVYGLSPLPRRSFGLRPALTLAARLALVKRVPPGHGVSYGHEYITGAATTLGLVPLGYGDAVPRHAGNVAPVFAAGRRRRIAGRVCMDQFVVDLGDDDAAAGDEVLLFGPGDHGEPTADEWACALGSIPNELVTRIVPRVPRVYTGVAGGWFQTTGR